MAKKKPLTDTDRLIRLRIALINHAGYLRETIDALMSKDLDKAVRALKPAVDGLDRALRRDIPPGELKKLDAARAKRGKGQAR